MTATITPAAAMLHAPRDFKRDGYGRPQVISPTDLGAHVWYTRPTTLAGTVADHFGVNRWKQAQVAVGVGLRPDLAAAAVVFKNDNGKLYELVAEAETAAAVAASSILGTTKHAMTAQVILGQSKIEELTPLLVDEVVPILETELDAFAGIEGVEFSIVNDDIECAGTADRLYRLPDGRCAVGDLKTGANAMEYGAAEIAVQLAIYSHGRPYDIETGHRGKWPDGFDPNVGFVLHAPSGQRPALYEFDLAQGWDGAALAYYVRRFRKLKLYKPAESINPPF
jgi:hypothetical protein